MNDCLDVRYKNLFRGMRFGLFLLGTVFGLAITTSLVADEAASKTDQTQPASSLTVERIFHKNEFEAKSFSARWLSGLPDSVAAFTTLEKSQAGSGGQDIVRHDVDGVRSILVSATHLIPPGESTPLSIEDYTFSDDHNLLLVYTNSQRVWRDNTRGDYWLLDRTSRQLRRLGGAAPASSMMFAKLSPNGQYVAFVRQGNIFMEDVRSQRIQQLTHSDSEDVINGTTDWVYEEELGLRDAFQWSPDSRYIAYLQVDTTDVPKFPLVNNTDALYPTIHWFAYPKVGQRNPTCRIGIVDCQTAQTQWLETPSDMPEYYLPRMSYLPGSDNRLLIQQLNRLQNTNDLLVSEANNVSRLLRESDEAWVDVHDELFWLKDGQHFTWISERDGWRHVYLASLKDGTLRLVTPGQFDVIELLCVDEQSGWIYFIASPDNATQRYLYQVRLDGSDLKKITDNRLTGTHQYNISPDRKWAIHTASTADQPPVVELVSLPEHAVVRTLEDNHELRTKISRLQRQPTEFFKVNLGDGIELDGWAILPPNRQPDEKVPLLVYVYGEPAGSTVVDRWGGSSYLWHLMLAQQGYAVMSFDNRGTKAPRGRAWRKSIYKQIGIIPPQDQAAAVRAVLKERPYIDSKRVGIWGWSGGGSSSLHAIFKYPDLYQTAVAVAPVPNQRYYDTIYQERYMSLPELNVQGFIEGSPINFAKQLQGNLLLIHGTGDDNCHYQTMELLIDELIAHNKQFSLMTYPNRTHAIRERANTTRHLRQLMTDYLLENLPPNK